MLTLNGGLQAAAVILAVVLASLSLGFWIGFRFAQRRPRLGALLGVITIAGFTFGPMGVLAATFKCTLPWCIASVVGWLAVSGIAWGCIMSDFGKGKRDSRNISFLQTMYLVGCGSVLTGLLVNLLNYVPGAGAEDMQLWTRQVGLFSITTMVYMALGSFVFWMFLWQRAALVKATPLAPDEKFLHEGEDAAASAGAKPPTTAAGVSGIPGRPQSEQPQRIAENSGGANAIGTGDGVDGGANGQDKFAAGNPAAADGASSGGNSEPATTAEVGAEESTDQRTKKLS